MDYKTLLNKLPKETELHYLIDTEKQYHIQSLNKNNIEYIIKKDSYNLQYILIK